MSIESGHRCLEELKTHPNCVPCCRTILAKSIAMNCKSGDEWGLRRPVAVSIEPTPAVQAPTPTVCFLFFGGKAKSKGSHLNNLQLAFDSRPLRNLRNAHHCITPWFSGPL